MNSPASPALDIDVVHHLGEFDLEVAFRIDAGLAVIVGPSGAGKSLTLRLVAGLDRPDTGTIAGTVVADPQAGIHVRTQQRRIGMVFQDGLLLPHRTARDNVALAVRDCDRHTRRRQATEWLERTDSADLADRHPTGLSGGQRQRVALARALAAEPDLLLLDEPLSALDLPVRRAMRTLVRDLVATTGVPALFITHDLAEADELADTLITYDHGHVASVEHRRGPAARGDEPGHTDGCR